MTRDEIIERLNRYEWSDVEFKEARNAAPRSAYETVSAFANTSRGWLVFGVRDRGGTLEMVGVMHVDRVQNEFLSTLRSRQKINRAIGVAEDVVETDGATLLGMLSVERMGEPSVRFSALRRCRGPVPDRSDDAGRCRSDSGQSTENRGLVLHSMAQAPFQQPNWLGLWDPEHWTMSRSAPN